METKRYPLPTLAPCTPECEELERIFEEMDEEKQREREADQRAVDRMDETRAREEAIRAEARQAMMGELKAAEEAETSRQSKRAARETAAKAKAKVAYLKNKHRQRAYTIARKYDLTLDQFQAMLQSQDGRCAACKAPFGLTRDLRTCIDHDHVTGRVRGLLCGMCNFTLGHAHDNPEILRGLIRYLESWDSYGTASGRDFAIAVGADQGDDV